MHWSLDWKTQKQIKPIQTLYWLEHFELASGGYGKEEQLHCKDYQTQSLYWFLTIHSMYSNKWRWSTSMYMHRASRYTYNPCDLGFRQNQKTASHYLSLSLSLQSPLYSSAATKHDPHPPQALSPSLIPKIIIVVTIVIVVVHVIVHRYHRLRHPHPHHCHHHRRHYHHCLQQQQRHRQCTITATPTTCFEILDVDGIAN